MRTSLPEIGIYLLLTGMVFGIPEIEVTPLDYDFGLVEVGSSDSAVITTYNHGDTTLTLEDVYFEASSSRDFTITSFLLPPVYMSSGAQFIIEVTFAPTSGGSASASLLIFSTDTDEPQVQVVFTGQAPLDEQNPQEQIATIIDFVEESILDGTLQGNGRGNSADKRLNALQNMLDRTQELIEEGMYEEAYQQLKSIYKKIDGQDKPDDFVQGPAVSELNAMILDLIQMIEELLEGTE